MAVDADGWRYSIATLIDIIHIVLDHNLKNSMIIVCGGSADPYKRSEHLRRARVAETGTCSTQELSKWHRRGISDRKDQQLLQEYKKGVGNTNLPHYLKAYCAMHFGRRIRVLIAPKEADAMTAHLYSANICNYVMARDADSCLVAPTIYRIGQLNKDGTDFNGICVLRPYDLQLALKKPRECNKFQRKRHCFTPGISRELIIQMQSCRVVVPRTRRYTS